MSNNIVIRDNESFHPDNFQSAVNELSVLRRGVAGVPIYYKVEIVVSFLKDHSLKTVWVEANPALSRMITSGLFKTSNLESLFVLCRNNKPFLKELEDYIGKHLLMAKN